MNTGPVGSELTKEPFRWDQRLFAIVLALPANASSATQASLAITTAGNTMGEIPSNQFIPTAIDQPITAMCDVTGGRYHRCLDEHKSPFLFLSRSIVSGHHSTSSCAMLRIARAKDSDWRCRQFRKSNQRRYRHKPKRGQTEIRLYKF